MIDGQLSLDGPPSDSFQGFDLAYILGNGQRKSWSSGAPSYIARSAGGSDSRRPSTSIAPWESYSSGRRSSTTTMSDDAFTSHIRKNDKNYSIRRDEWSFHKETVDGPGSSLSTSRTGRPAVHELWRHQYVGRFKVDKQWTERA